MKYSLLIDETALEQLRSLPKETRRNIGFRLDALQDSFQGDIKKLADEDGLYRLRVEATEYYFG